MVRSVQLARDGAPDGWVAGSVGPYGAYLADGSEYTGAYVADVSVAELRAFHRPRLEVLAGAGADVLACETLPAAAEVEALLAELTALDVPAWISVSAVTGRDGVARTRRGEPLSDVLAMTRGVDQVVAVGVNCTDPAAVVPAVAAAAEAGGKPVVVYPNSGETWDAARPGVDGHARGRRRHRVAGRRRPARGRVLPGPAGRRPRDRGRRPVTRP